MGVTCRGESAEYRAGRDRLLSQEIELRRAMEAVAAARRELPDGGRVERISKGEGVLVVEEDGDLRVERIG